MRTINLEYARRERMIQRYVEDQNEREWDREREICKLNQSQVYRIESKLTKSS